MKRFQDFLFGLHPLLLSSIASALTVAQMIIAIFLPGLGNELLGWVGWICLWTAGIFGMIPIFTFRKKGGVSKGQSYMKTTVLVDSGIYSIVRHPQGGTASLLINLGLILISCQWSSVVLGLISMVLFYLDTYKSDEYCIDKFGDAYRQYMVRVPKVNFLAGIIRLLFRRQ